MKSSAKKVELAPYDDLFSTEESRQDAKLEKVREIPLSELHPFKNHPFKVKDDEAMMETADSVRQYGVLVPAIARPDPEGGYELVAGHRRHRASELAEKETMPVIVRDLDDDAATIIMVDSNLQRESLLPSERAFAYKLKLEAMKHQGERRDLTCAQLGHKSDGKKSRDILAEQVGQSKNQIQRFIRLTELIPELLDINALSSNLIMVDRKLLKNPNGLILGTPGSGKSFSAKREIANCFLLTTDDVIICDPEAEYAPLVERLHGQVIKISPTSTNYINPMDLNLDYSDDESPLSLNERRKQKIEALRLAAEAGDPEAIAQYEQHLSKLRERNQKYRQKVREARELQAEYARLLEEKKKTYAEYRRSREEMRDLLAAKANVDRLMSMEEEKQSEKEHER